MQLLCVGDIALERALTPWSPLARVAPDDESKIIFNWELPIGKVTKSTPRPYGGPRLLSHPDSIKTIHKWAPGYAALATNHILDAGEEGLSDTIDALHQAGFETIGAGLSTDEIVKPVIWETNEGRLAIINWVFPETHPDWLSMPGPNCWPGIDEAQKIISELKQNVDWLLVYAHWSDELFPYPQLQDREIARQLASTGIDFLVCHHPHVVRGMEVVGSCPVFYSLGNLYFSNYSNKDKSSNIKWAPRNREGLGVLISFNRGQKPGYQVVSFWQTRGRVISDPLQRARKRMELVSRPLINNFQGSGYSDWYNIQRAKFNTWGYRFHFSLYQQGLPGLVGFLNRLRSK